MLAVSRSTTTVADAEEGGFRILREYFCGDTHALFAKMDDTVHPYSVSSLRMKKKKTVRLHYQFLYTFRRFFFRGSMRSAVVTVVIFVVKRMSPTKVQIPIFNASSGEM